MQNVKCLALKRCVLDGLRDVSINLVMNRMQGGVVFEELAIEPSERVVIDSIVDKVLEGSPSQNTGRAVR